MSSDQATNVRAVVEQRADGTLFFAPRGDCVTCDGSCGLALGRGGVDVPLPTSLMAGESVTLRVSTRGLRGAAFQAFGLPLAGMVLGTTITTSAGLGDGGVLTGALFGLILAVTATALRSKALRGQSVAVTVLDSASGFVNNGALCGATRRFPPVG